MKHKDSGAYTCAVRSREESVAGSCVAGLIPGGRVPEERSRRGGAAVCRSVTAPPARRALAAVSSCAATRAAIVPSSDTSYVYLLPWYAWHV